MTCNRSSERLLRAEYASDLDYGEAHAIGSTNVKMWTLNNVTADRARYWVERCDRHQGVILSTRHEHAYEYLLVRLQNGMGRVVVMPLEDALVMVYEFESLIEATKFMFNQAIVDIGLGDEFEGFVEAE